MSWILREVIPSLLCWTLESLGQNWGLGRWFEGLRKGDKPCGSKNEQSTECISYKFLLKREWPLRKKKHPSEWLSNLDPEGFQYVSHPPRRHYLPFHYGKWEPENILKFHAWGAFGWYIHKCEEMRGLKVSREYPAMYVGEHYWQDGQPLSFSDGEILCFLHGQELQGESGEPPKYMRNQDGSHGLNGSLMVVWCRITHHWRISLNLHTLQ